MAAEPVRLVLTVDGLDFEVDLSGLPRVAGVAPERRVAAMLALIQGWLARSEIVVLTGADGAQLLMNWRAVRVVQVRLPGDVSR